MLRSSIDKQQNLLFIHEEMRNNKYIVHVSDPNQNVPVLWETQMKKSNYKN